MKHGEIVAGQWGPQAPAPRSPSRGRRLSAWAAGTALAVAIFLVDCGAGLQFSVAVLYLLVPVMLSATGRSEDVAASAVLTIFLAVVAWILVHAAEPDFGSAMRLLVSIIAIAVTSGLVISRQKLDRARRDLKASSEELINFTDSMPQLLWRAGPSLEVDFFNRRFTDLTGHDREEAIALQNWTSFIHPDDRQQFASACDRARASGADIRCEYRMRHGDDNYRWMSLVGRAVRSERNGRPLRWYGGVSDIHQEVIARRQISEMAATLEQKVEERTRQLRLTEAHYASLFELSSMTVMELDFTVAIPMIRALQSEGIVDVRDYFARNPAALDRIANEIRTTRVTRAMVELLGFERETDILGRSPIAMGAEARDCIVRQIDMYFSGGDHVSAATNLVTRSGVKIPTIVNVVRFADGLHLVSHVDLSEQQRIADLKQSALDDLERANRLAAVGAFSASIAHELSQPITSLAMDAQTCLRWLRRDEPDLAAIEKALERVSKTSNRVGAILQHTRDNIISGRRVLRPTHLAQIIRETETYLEPRVRRHDIDLVVRLPDDRLTVHADPVELQQVLTNLVNNAIDALEDRESPRSIVIDVNDADATVRVSVRDNGAGIDEAILEKLFDPFFTTKTTGIGMGLQICRTVVEAMGGTLQAANADGGGAQFILELPKDQATRH